MLQIKKRTRRESLTDEVQDYLELPDLNEIQLASYNRFLQMDKKPEERDAVIGLEAVFRNTFPIESPNKDIVLEYHGYTFGNIQYSEEEARRRDVTYSIVLKATIRLIYRETGEVREKEVYMGDIPLMTPRGTFIINGAERVIVSQIHKSPGIAFSEDDGVFLAKIIPDKGAWLEFELDTKKDILNIKIDRKKGVLVTTFLQAIGCETTTDIIKEFYTIKEIDLSKNKDRKFVESSTLPIRIAEDIVEPQTNEVIFHAPSELILQDTEKILSFGINKIKIIDPEELVQNPIILKCLDIDDVTTSKEAIAKLYNFIRPGEPITLENATKEFNALFFDPKRYNLGIVGRYKFNQKLYTESVPGPDSPTPTKDDIILAIKYLIKIYNGTEYTDDIDHLGNRRIRCVDELLVNQLKIGFSRMERTIKERISTEDFEEITPQKLLSIKPISAVIKEFFGSSQLSQFMDQTNPLAELTHKRRINALGPGGLSRERAGFEVRDVHYTHYGKICPIETPEGPNIGLILSLCNFARINDYGFLITPYVKVENGKVTKEVSYLTATEEDRYYIAPANLPRDSKGNIKGELVDARYRGEYPLVHPSQIKYIDVSPKQIISVSTALIPFLQHDDANRALMGANMQRQAVPLLNVEAPVVGTGMESKAAYDSGTCLISKRSGTVIKVSAEEVHIKVDDDAENPVDIYNLIKYRRTNQNTCFNQRPQVVKGEEIELSQIIADGPAIDNGELSLGRNVLVAFMSWKGQNFEDAIIISDRMVKEDIFTSIHIEEFEIEARETKLGREKITKDIPNLGEDSFTHLNEDGIVRVGTWVQSGDILVGKVTPKGETESTPEYKLLHSIFGEKAREVKDTSLRVPHSNSGVVIGISIFKRENEDELPPGVEELVKVHIAKKRKISEGDKMAGRHGNKGVISKIVPEEDMPYLPDGTPVDIILNPLGVPSRMNLGQILESELGWAAKELGVNFAVPVFADIKLEQIESKLKEAKLPIYSSTKLIDGLTGEYFENEVTVGYIYMLKLSHMIDDKIHARSTGPYSLVTQQPLGGKAQFGGQRLGEMEVWALEAYGAAHTLQEFLTVKADDMMGRAKIYENIVKGEITYRPGVPESFNVLIQELRGLGLDLNIYDNEDNLVGLTDKDIENLNKLNNKI